MERLLKSPFNYGGGKFKLLPQILPMFPTNIHRFVDLFGGSAEVTLNVDADVRIYNDKNQHMVNILQNLDYAFVDEVKQLIAKYGLTKTSYDEFYALRKYYNDNRKIMSNRENAVVLYVIIAHAFNYQMAFNSEGEYNMASGRNRCYFSADMEKRCYEYIERINACKVQFNYSDFTTMNLNDIRDGDFFYADPPYLVSVGAYERNFYTRWNETKERELLALLDTLNERGSKFALSNVLTHKGSTNERLLEWSKKYNVHHLDMTYWNCNYQTNSRKEQSSDEVLITNY